MPTRPKLTPHQRTMLDIYTRALVRTGCPVPVSTIGSVGAVHKLEEKGYLTTEDRPGVRGGSHLYVTGVTERVPVLCFHAEHCGTLTPDVCAARPGRRSA